MMMELAPVVLFAYKRLELLKRTVEHLQRNRYADESVLYVFSDAAKDESETAIINQVRTFIRSITGFHQLVVIEAVVHKGLATSVIEGVSEVLLHHDRVIVLEDDLLTSPNFLNFMNHALDYYQTNSGVFSISGYNYDFPKSKAYHFDNYFVSRGCSWGWATWKNRWSNLNWEIGTYDFDKDYFFKKSFNKSGSDLYSMLCKQRSGLIDSWAIRWYYNQWLSKGLTCYPVSSLISNEGFDVYATHTKVYNRYKTYVDSDTEKCFAFNPVVVINNYYQKQIQLKFSVMQRIFFGKLMTVILHVLKTLRRD